MINVILLSRSFHLPQNWSQIFSCHKSAPLRWKVCISQLSGLNWSVSLLALYCGFERCRALKKPTFRSLWLVCILNVCGDSLWHLWKSRFPIHNVRFVLLFLLEISLLYYMSAIKFLTISTITSCFQRALTSNFQGVKIFQLQFEHKF